MDEVLRCPESRRSKLVRFFNTAIHVSDAITTGRLETGITLTNSRIATFLLDQSEGYEKDY